MVSSSPSGMPTWHGLLAAANQELFADDDVKDASSVLRRATLLRDVKQNHEDPVCWCAYLNLLTARREVTSRDDPRHGVMGESLRQLFEAVVRLVPLTPSNRYSKEYLDLWLGLAKLQEEEYAEDARDTFKLIKMQRIGRYRPAFYEAWAAFEERLGNQGKATKLREDAIRICPQQKRKSPTPNATATNVKDETNKREQLQPATREETNKRQAPKPNRIPKQPPIRESIFDRTHKPRPQPSGENALKSTTNANVRAARPMEPRRVDVNRKRPDTVKNGVEQRVPLASIQERVGANVGCTGGLHKVAPGISKPVHTIRAKENTPPVKEIVVESITRTPEQRDVRPSRPEKPELKSAEVRISPVQRAPTRVANAHYPPPKPDKKAYHARKEHSPDVRDERRYREQPMLDRQYSSPGRSRLDYALSRQHRISINGRTYQMLKQVGKGGSSQVYKVISEDMDVLALKRVHVNPENRIALTSYANEIDLLRSLVGEKTIVQLRDSEVIEATGEIHVVMELGDIDLAKLLKAQTIEFDVLRMYWRQMLAAVRTIHRRSIIHGDLKPANFISVAGCLKLIDFGIAKSFDDTDDGCTKIVRDCIMGTPNYMAPEALHDIGEYDEGERRGYRVGRASDIWSLGCILYQMVYGKTPFAHIRNTLRKTQIIKDAAHEIQFKDTGDAALEDVLRGCLQRNPDKRYSIPQLLAHPFLTGAGSSMLGLPTSRDIADEVVTRLRNERFQVCDTAGQAVSDWRVHGVIERSVDARRAAVAARRTHNRAHTHAQVKGVAAGGTPSVSAITKASSGLAV